MSGTPGLGAFNKDKVANKFGIQLKPKDANKQSPRPSTSSIEKGSTTTGTSNVIKNKTIGDFRTENNINGFGLTNRSPSSKTPEATRKIAEKPLTSKSTSALVNTSINNERSNSLTSNVNHSTAKSKESIKSVPESSSSNVLLPSKSPGTVKRSSITSTDRGISPELSPIKRPSMTKTAERDVSPALSAKQVNAPKTTTKTEAQIEHQKDQPLYKRQLSKTLENTPSTANKTKHQQEPTKTTPTPTPTIAAKR
jgi:hypothetical protein